MLDQHRSRLGAVHGSAVLGQWSGLAGASGEKSAGGLVALVLEVGGASFALVVVGLGAPGSHFSRLSLNRVDISNYLKLYLF